MSRTVVAVESIAAFTAAAWDHCFADEPENWAYYRATESAGLPGFCFRYYAVVEGGRILAAVPGFFTEYRLDTTVQGRLKRVMATLTRWLPRLMILRLACLGSPVAECCHLGFAPEVTAAERGELARALLERFEADAAAAGRRLLAIKDVPAAAQDFWRALLAPRYRFMPGLPTAWLPIDFSDEDGYLAKLSKATRKDIKRKLRSRTEVRIEMRQRVDDVLPQMMALYAQTRNRSELQFEELTPAWFAGVLGQGADSAEQVQETSLLASGAWGEQSSPQTNGHGGRSHPQLEGAACFLYWVGETLAGFNLVVFDKNRLIDKFVGLDGALGRAHNLYFVSWMENIAFCLRRKIPVYQSGQAEYGPKIRLDCQFAANYLWFRHTRRPIDAVLALLARVLRIDKFDEDLARLPGIASDQGTTH